MSRDSTPHHQKENEKSAEVLEKSFSAFTSRYFYNAFNEMLPACLFAKDRKGRYLYVNDSFVQLTNSKTREEIIGSKPSEIFSEDRGTRAEQEDEEIMSSGEGVFERENMDRISTGGERYVMVSKVPVKDDAGDVIGLAGAMFDVTDRKKNEQRLQELYLEVEEKNRQLEEDLGLAKEVQQAFMALDDQIIENESISIAKQHHASNKIGGDLLIVDELEEGVWSVFLCDVMGHGVRAALITGMLRGLYDDLRSDILSPGQFLSKLNDRYNRMLHSLNYTVFVTSSLAIFDCRVGEMKLATAGHHDPVWYRSSLSEFASTDVQIATRSPAIGLIESCEYVEKVHPIGSGDLFVFFTDGIWDSLCAEGVNFDYEQLTQLLGSEIDKSATKIVSRVIDTVFSNTPQIPDDICISVVKIG